VFTKLPLLSSQFMFVCILTYFNKMLYYFVRLMQFLRNPKKMAGVS